MAFENQYSFLDQFLHRIAFSTWTVQAGLSDFENSLYKEQLKKIRIRQPVFVTALPRAGTTLLLELFVDTGEFVSHTYRQMPFILCPLLWDSFSRKFKQNGAPRERAHGDGMLVSADSAEAFEEILWRLFWKKHYHAEYIDPWSQARDGDFEAFFKDHIKKIILLGGSAEKASTHRYVSKNNLNISRIPYLKTIFPDAIIIIPFREPYQHALSLLRQHKNFLAIHKEDGFAKRYMQAIGHYDFGANLKPVNFADWVKGGGPIDACRLEFWLKYWLACYKNILELAKDSICLLSYETLCKNPRQGLEVLGEKLELGNADALLSQADRISLAKPHSVDLSDVGKELQAEIASLYETLIKISVIKEN